MVVGLGVGCLVAVCLGAGCWSAWSWTVPDFVLPDLALLWCLGFGRLATHLTMDAWTTAHL